MSTFRNDPPTKPVVTIDERIKAEKIEADFGSIRLVIYSNGEVWLICPDGEGMQCNTEAFTKALNEFYSVNF